MEWAREVIGEFIRRYNDDRPHSSLGNLPPGEFARNLEPKGTSGTKKLTLHVV
jgi:transposase InsO family protein